MYRNPDTHHQSRSSNFDNYKTVNESVMKSPSSRLSRQSTLPSSDHYKTHNDSNERSPRQLSSPRSDNKRTINDLAMKPPGDRISLSSDHFKTRNESNERSPRQLPSPRTDHYKTVNESVMKSPNDRISRQSISPSSDHFKTRNVSDERPSRQLSSPRTDNYKTVDKLVMKPSSGQTSRQSISPSSDHYRTRNESNERSPRQLPSPRTDSNKTISELVQKPPGGRTSRQSITKHDDEFDDDRNPTLKRLVSNQPLNPHRSQSPSSSTVSLKSMVIEGKWKYRGREDEHLRLKAIGIENLVNICHDIMSKTYESTNEKRQKPSSSKQPWPVVNLDEYNSLTKADRNALNRAKVFNLMTIVYEAASTSASISNLVRIWREASELALHPRRSKSRESRPLISYETAFQHLIRAPDDQLLQIGVHASLISTYNASDLQHLGKKLGVQRNEFDITSILKSIEAFRNLIKYLREQKMKQRYEQKFIDIDRLPYERKKKQGLSANVSGTKYRLIRQAADVSGFDISPDPDFTSNLLWNDTLISMDIVSALKPYQKINHFPTMNEISRKDLLAKNYDRLSNHLPNDYNFAPKTWVLPTDYNLWYSYASNKPRNDPSVYILKPSNAAMSQGIAIHCGYKQVQPMDNYIIQEYIREPYLLDGFKFDLRIYALITSCDPLRVFLFNNGLVRISSKKYQIPTPKNALDLGIHLTNYETDEFASDPKRRSLKSLFKDLKTQNKNTDKLWKEIQNIVIKTIFLAEPHLLTAYRHCRQGTLPTSDSVCFELLGFDILIDKNFRPWIIEVNRCPSFETIEEIEFDIKIKLLLDTLNLLHFQPSDRKKSIRTEKIEAKRRLYSTLGKRLNELDELKENLSLLRRDRARENYENEHSNGFIRLFPTDDQYRMNELMNILTKSFQILSPKKNNLSWNVRYINQYNENDLLDKIAQLEKKLTPDRSATNNEKRRESPESFRKIVSTQTPKDILRSTSASSLNIPKQPTNAVVTTGNVSRPDDESLKRPPGISASRITEKKSPYSSETSENPERQRPHSSKPRRSSDKSQMVTYSSILQATRQQQLIDEPTPTDITKELQLTPNDINRLHQLIYDRMDKVCIRYPNKSDEETYQIYDRINDNWDRYKTDIGRFWLAELDTDKRESVVEIVWKNVQEIIIKICVIDELVQQLPLNRQLIKLKRRLLANHGQCLWDVCQNRHNSWESLFLKSTNTLSTIELDSCYCFADLCKQAVFIVYQYSIDEKRSKHNQTNHELRIMIST